MPIPFIEENDQTQARHEHLNALRDLVGNIYPNKFERWQKVAEGRDDTISAIVEKFGAFAPQVPKDGRPPAEEIELANQQLNGITVRVAGRIATPPRIMGKAAFVHLSDGTSRLQTYVRKADVKAVNNDTVNSDTRGVIEEEGKGWELFGLLDHGDFIGVEGYLFITKTGELSVHVLTLQFLAKALMPLPDKLHGINDPEIRQRQRYADLIAGSLKLELKGEEENEGQVGSKTESLTPRQVFERRAKVISEFRRILDDHGYIEVETPMLTPLATGAAAKPFKTHHNALDIDLYARIAPELYLKRLLVGGFEKVYELNRNFRNEGISTRHNPEFTMLEFYWAYADVNQMMDFCEEMLLTTVMRVLKQSIIPFAGIRPAAYLNRQEAPEAIDLDFTKVQRLTMKEAICQKIAARMESVIDQDLATLLDNGSTTRALLDYLWWLENDYPNLIEGEDGAGVSWSLSDDEQLRIRQAEWLRINKSLEGQVFSEANAAQQLLSLFEDFVESELIQPTFIYNYPKPISPLSKASPEDPTIAERFELFIAGMEVANGFSELNDPQEQYQRFMDQMLQRDRGDEEAMVMDEDYIRALSYGMPPAAGIGIGIDRFVMLVTNRQSIRDVILFPHMRPQRFAPETIVSE